MLNVIFYNFERIENTFQMQIRGPSFVESIQSYS